MGRENYGALANLDIAAALDRIAAGESVGELAAELGVAAESLRVRLLRADTEAYQAALATQIGSRLIRYADQVDAVGPMLDSAQVRLDSGDSAAANAQTGIARAVIDAAEAGARHWRWLGERRLPDLYGQKTQVKQEHSGTVAIEVRPRVSRDEWVRAHALRDESGSL